MFFLNSRLHFQENQFKVLPVVHLYQPGMWNPFFFGLKKLNMRRGYKREVRLSGIFSCEFLCEN